MAELFHRLTDFPEGHKGRGRYRFKTGSWNLSQVFHLCRRGANAWIICHLPRHRRELSLEPVLWRGMLESRTTVNPVPQSPISPLITRLDEHLNFPLQMTKHTSTTAPSSIHNATKPWEEWNLSPTREIRINYQHQQHHAISPHFSIGKVKISPWYLGILTKSDLQKKYLHKTVFLELQRSSGISHQQNKERKKERMLEEFFQRGGKQRPRLGSVLQSFGQESCWHQLPESVNPWSTYHTVPRLHHRMSNGTELRFRNTCPGAQARPYTAQQRKEQHTTNQSSFTDLEPATPRTPTGRWRQGFMI